MGRIAWVTDSTAFFDDELQQHPDVYQVPMTVILDEKEYVDGVDLTAEELFDRLKTLKMPPKTSQPSIGAFQELFEKLSENYDSIITVLVSSKLSGTVSSSEQAAQLVDIPVTTIDSRILSYPLTALIKKGIEWAKVGVSIEEIKERFARIIPTNETYVLIGSLEQLHRSGRMSGLQFFLGSVLNIKPIISIEDGALNAKEKIRSEKKAMERITQYLRDSYEKYLFREVYLLYGLHEQQALDWMEQLKVDFPEITFRSCPLGATIGVHAGENTLGISWFQQLE